MLADPAAGAAAAAHPHPHDMMANLLDISTNSNNNTTNNTNNNTNSSTTTTSTGAPPKAKRSRKEKNPASSSTSSASSLASAAAKSSLVLSSSSSSCVVNGGVDTSPAYGLLPQPGCLPPAYPTPNLPLAAQAPAPAPTAAAGVKLCAACNMPIQDRYLLFAMDRYWHQACLRCSCCQAYLADIAHSCYQKQGMILCKDDYVRMFGSAGACSRCGYTIPATDLVMKVGAGSVYHLACFHCDQCSCQLRPGDRFTFLQGALLCEMDTVKMVKYHQQQYYAQHQQQALQQQQGQQQQQQQPTTKNTKVC